jgi:hypothetical protein
MLEDLALVEKEISNINSKYFSNSEPDNLFIMYTFYVCSSNSQVLIPYVRFQG